MLAMIAEAYLSKAPRGCNCRRCLVARDLLPFATWAITEIMRPVRRFVEKCGECSPRSQCANHLACAKHADAKLAAAIGIGWAEFVKGARDIRKPWPDFKSDCKAIAVRLVYDLALTDERRAELARICWWRAGLRWEALKERHRDRPYQQPDGRGAIYALPGSGTLFVHFRTRQSRNRSGSSETHRPRTRKYKP